MAKPPRALWRDPAAHGAVTLTAGPAALDALLSIDVDAGLRDKALARALKEAATRLRQAAIRILRSVVNLPRTEIAAGVSVAQTKAQGSAPSAVVWFRSRRLPLIAFSPRPSTPEARRPPGGLSVTINRLSGPKVRPGTFIGRSRRGLGVYARTTHDAYPIHEKFGPSFVSYLQEDKPVMQAIEAAAGPIMDERLAAAADRLASLWRGGAS